MEAQRKRHLVVDVGLALGLFVLAVVALYGASGETSAVRVNGGLIAASPGGVVVVLIGLAPIAVRRMWPMLALAVSSGVFAVTAFTDELDRLPLLVGVLLCLYSFAAIVNDPSERRIGGAIASVTAVLSVSVGLRWHGGDWFPWIRDGGLELVGFAAAWVLGTAAERREAAKRDLTLRATLAEDHAVEATSRERARIARELHDIVGHAISVISVQATVGEHLATTDPEQARAALATIHEMSQQAMEEMRHLVGVLREDGNSDVDLSPQPGLADVDALLTEAEQGGTTVRFERSGDAVPLTAGVGLAAFRVIQEALTNARKHAPGAAVTVQLRYGRDDLTIDVVNAPPPDDLPASRLPTGAETAGFGLLAMRERVSVYHGTLDAGPGDDGSFRVRACLPYRDAVVDGKIIS